MTTRAMRLRKIMIMLMVMRMSIRQRTSMRAQMKVRINARARVRSIQVTVLTRSHLACPVEARASYLRAPTVHASPPVQRMRGMFESHRCVDACV